MSAASQDGIFGLAEQKLAWIDARQRVLAQNVANADTPGYRPRDVPAFGTLLGALPTELARTSPLHLTSLQQEPGFAPQLADGERAPDGNTVAIEKEMTKVADCETEHALTSNIWHSYMSMFMTALGHAG